MPAQRARIGKRKYGTTGANITLNVTTMLLTAWMSAVTRKVVNLCSEGYYSQKPQQFWFEAVK